MARSELEPAGRGIGAGGRRARAQRRHAGLERGRAGGANSHGVFAAVVHTPHELLVVYDMPEDTTVPVVERLLGERSRAAGIPE